MLEATFLPWSWAHRRRPFSKQVKRELLNLMSHVYGAKWAGGTEVAGMGLRAHICVVSDYMSSSPLKKETVQYSPKCAKASNKILEAVI